MHIIHHRLFAISSLLLTGLLVACGTPEDFQPPSDEAPSREELIGRLQSPDESEDVERFRIKAVTSFSGELYPDGFMDAAESGEITVEADVTTNPPAIHLRMITPAFASASAPDTLQMMAIDGRFWVDEGDGWEEQDPELEAIFSYLLESFSDLSKPTGPLGDSPETTELLREAEIVGTDEINGRRTTHFHMSTEAHIALMMERYEEPVEGADGDACDGLEALGDDARDLDDGEGMDAFFECMGTALVGEMPPPDEYIERFDVDLWISDDGFVMREHTVTEMSYMPMLALFDDDQRSPIAMETTFDLYDLNADFEITAPEIE